MSVSLQHLPRPLAGHPAALDLRWARRLVWLLPLVTAYLVAKEPERYLEYAVGACIALPVLAWAVRHPDRALITLAIFLPLETVGFGFLLGAGVPAGILRGASALKELLAAALVLAGFNEVYHRRRRLAAVDAMALLYLAVVTVYLVVPHLFSPLDDSFDVRVLAWRVDCGYVLVFLGVRHAPIDLRGRTRLWRVILAIGALTVVTGLIQKAEPIRWSALLLHAGRATTYLTGVIHDTPAVAAQSIAYLTNLDPLRVSALFESPFDMSDYLLVVAAYLLARIVRGREGAWQYVLLAGVAAVLFFSRVRADAVGFCVIALVALLPSIKKPSQARMRLLGAVLLGAVLVLPVLGGTRFVGAQGGAASDHAHVDELSLGITTLESHPLGLGLGANPETATRFLLPGNEQGALTTDNVFTQVGDELGWEGLIPWTAFVLAVGIGIRRRAAAPDGDVLVAAGGLALLGVMIAGQYHEAFLNYDACWTLWAAAGAALTSLPGEGSREEPLATMTFASLPGHS